MWVLDPQTGQYKWIVNTGSIDSPDFGGTPNQGGASAGGEDAPPVGPPPLPPAPAPVPGQADEEKQQAAYGRINALFSPDKRGPIYQGVYDNAYNLQSSRLNESREQMLKKLRFGLARTGLTGGSVDADQKGMEQRSFSRSLMDASQAAQGQADTLRGNDEKTRLNLIAQMRSGLDEANATSSSLEQLRDSTAQAQNFNNYGAVDNYISSVSPAINAYARQQGVQIANDRYGGPTYRLSSSYTGSRSQ